jgi:hypothetical protein
LSVILYKALVAESVGSPIDSVLYPGSARPSRRHRSTRSLTVVTDPKGKGIRLGFQPQPREFLASKLDAENLLPHHDPVPVNVVTTRFEFLP